MSHGAVITIKHIRSARLCTKGARAWFDANGMSWSDFLENGVAVERVEHMNDAYAQQMVALAKEEAESGR